MRYVVCEAARRPFDIPWTDSRRRPLNSRRVSLVPHAGTGTAMRTSLRGYEGDASRLASCRVPICRRGAPEEFAIESTAREREEATLRE